MRKFFIILSTLSFATVTSLPIIACTNPFFDPNVYRVSIVTDGNVITDHSFNESAYDGSLQFQREFNIWSHSVYANDSPFKNKRVEISWDNPQHTDLNTLMTAYNKAVFIYSKVIIATGFLHHDALVKAQNGFLRKKGVKFIFVDGDTKNSEVSKDHKQLAGLLYKAEQSGFLAGLAGAVWLAAHNSDYGGINNLKMTTYGGVDIPSVTNYMYGYYWAIKLFNDEVNFNPIKAQLLNWVKKLNKLVSFKSSDDLPKISFVYAGTQFSDDFVQASHNSKAINDALVAQGSNIIFPVAGPQTADTLASLGKNGKGMIIGVDSDQSKQYPGSADRFITSAEKDVKHSVNYMLWRSINRTEVEVEHPYFDAKAIFQDNAIYRSGDGFTGITNNKPIKPIYDDLIHNREITKTDGLLDLISAGWKKVLANKEKFWINGIKPENNPFK